MPESVGVRELRQNLSRYLDRVKSGEGLLVTERGEVVARLVPAGASADAYGELVTLFGASVPIEPLEAIAARLSATGAKAGTTDAFLAEGRAERTG